MNKEELKIYLEKLYQKACSLKSEGEIPVVAGLVLSDGTFILKGNEVEKDNNPLSHAEINVIKEGLKISKNRYLKDATMIVTLEPCLMCLGAILKTRIKALYYIVDDPQYGGLSHYHAFVDDVLQVSQIQDSRFNNLLNDCFNKLRKR
ncbi:MAG: nucleoside deaminase [Bacilli bacterium]|jgi:tRNA(adenine34) deaminase